MLKRIAGAPGFVSVAGALALAALTVLAYLIVFDPVRKTVGYCALLPDAVGLYPGNHVTMRGIPVGTVDSVRPEGIGVRVEFRIEAERVLYGEVTATTVADSLVADRDLAVLGEAGSTAAWDPRHCVRKTFTPKSISATLQSFSRLAEQLNGVTVPGERTRIQDGVLALADATAGTGPALNRLIKDLGQALRAPDAAVGHLGALLDSYADLINSIALNWDDITATLARTGAGIAFINQLWNTMVQLIDSLLVILPWFNDLAREWGRELLGALDGALPGLRLLAANAGTLQQILTMIPPIVDSFTQVLDPVTGRPRLTYAPPRVALPPAQSEQICAAIGTLAPGRCHTGASLLPLLLGSAGNR
ncbi:MlaD family protein [Nocardia sp. NPDC127579]|uniref:MlaD family protein n=1 Tax=Nocardia sp. NPDC127579 TaxID=3345402 RepID=UPI00362BBA31